MHILLIPHIIRMPSVIPLSINHPCWTHTFDHSDVYQTQDHLPHVGQVYEGAHRNTRVQIVFQINFSVDTGHKESGAGITVAHEEMNIIVKRCTKLRRDTKIARKHVPVGKHTYDQLIFVTVDGNFTQTNPFRLGSLRASTNAHQR